MCPMHAGNTNSNNTRQLITEAEMSLFLKLNGKSVQHHQKLALSCLRLENKANNSLENAFKYITPEADRVKVNTS